MTSKSAPPVVRAGLAFLSLLVSIPLNAQSPGVVLSGMVTDLAGKPVAGARVSLNQVLRTLSQITGKPLEAKYDPPREGDIRDSQADVSQAKKFLGYEPQVSLEEGLKLTFDWYRESQLKAAAKEAAAKESAAKEAAAKETAAEAEK